VVNVPVNSATNFYLANLAFLLASDYLKNQPANATEFSFVGTAMVNSQAIPITQYYTV
jgi:hypothetical protein